MLTAYVFAHFDDEYCALPLIRRAQAQGVDQRFIYLADYRTARLSAVRHAETRRFFQRIGLGDPTLHLGGGADWQDGELHRHLLAIHPRLKATLTGLGPVDRLVTLAWEGGHPDHDACAALSARLAAELGDVEVDQISLYQGARLAGPLFRCCAPLDENGPTRDLPLDLPGLVGWGRLVSCYPSQFRTWCGLLPSMALTFLRDRRFRYQQLRPGRIAERPHAGRLLYERMFGVPYETVRADVDALMAAG